MRHPSCSLDLVFGFRTTMRIATFLLLPTAIAFGCGSNRSVVDARIEQDVFRPAEVVGRTIIADELRLYPRYGEVSRFAKRNGKQVRMMSQDDDLLIDYGIYSTVELMISQSDVIRIEVDRVVYLDHGPPTSAGAVIVWTFGALLVVALVSFGIVCAEDRGCFPPPP